MNVLIISVVTLYTTVSNPIDNIKYPMIKLASIFLRNFNSLINDTYF